MISIYADGTCTSLPFIYAHGEAEKMLGGDLISTESRISSPLTGQEIRHCEIYNRKEDIYYDGLLFLWEAEQPERLIGLVVLLSDTKSIEYALDLYKRKANHL